MLDLRTLGTKKKSSEGIVVNIVNPATNVPVGIRITALGTDSPEVRSFNRKRQNERLARSAKSRNGRLKLTAEELEQDSLDQLVFATRFWEQQETDEHGQPTEKWVPTINLDGQQLECTPENARKLYSDPDFLWIKEQVDEDMADRSAFLQNS